MMMLASEIVSYNALALAVVCSIIAPVVIALVGNRDRRLARSEDWARQDVIAERAQQYADAQAARQTLIAERVAEVAAEAEKTSKLQTARLEQIHTLVNSNLTAALQDQLDTRKENLVLLRESMAVKQYSGIAPSLETLAVIETASARIAELEAQMKDRLKSTEEAEAKLQKDMGQPLL